MRREVIQGNGLEIALAEWRLGGEGPPLVLLHGITGRALDWDPVVQALGALAPFSSRVIALDARGHGYSDWDPDGSYGGDQHFADVVQVLTRLGIECCLLAGFSMGGGVAIMTAAANPSLVKRLVVVDSYPGPLMTDGSFSIAQALSSWWKRFGSTDGIRPDPPLGGFPFDPRIAGAFARDLAAGDPRRLDLWPFWEALECSTLIIRGELSTVLPADVASMMVARQPLSRLETLPGVGHGLPFARPRQLATALSEFLGA